MKALVFLHQQLESLGKVIADLVVFAMGCSLFLLLAAATLFAIPYAAITLAVWTGAGAILAIPTTFIVWGLVGLYVAPHVSPKLEAVLKALSLTRGPN